MGKRLLITGGTGYLGGALGPLALRRGYDVAASHLSQQPPPGSAISWMRLDIRDPRAVQTTLEQARPDIVIHTAFVQYEPDLMAITAEGSGHVARSAANLGARLVHMSSDVIFDGERDGAYREGDPPTPISAYGEAKAAAERLVAAAHPAAAIVRTSLIYGFDPVDRQTRFALEIAAGRRGDKLFSDEFRCPIFVDDLAAALLDLAETDYAGVINIAGAERLSRYEIGALMAEAFGYDPATIAAGRSADLPVRRPRNCTLDSSRAQALLSTRLRGLREVLADMRSGVRSQARDIH